MPLAPPVREGLFRPLAQAGQELRNQGFVVDDDAACPDGLKQLGVPGDVQGGHVPRLGGRERQAGRSGLVRPGVEEPGAKGAAMVFLCVSPR